jgi:hypothetical protein
MRDYHLANGSVSGPFGACEHCETKCTYRDTVALVVYDADAQDRFRDALRRLDESVRAGDTVAGFAALTDECRRPLRRIERGDDPHAAYCYFAHLCEYKVTEAAARRFRATIEGAVDGPFAGLQ